MSNDGPDYVVASRQGLYFVNHTRARRVAEGVFFGVAVRGSTLYCFKTAPTQNVPADKVAGSVVRYERMGETLSGPVPILTGLDHNGHQLDYFDGTLYLVDTFNQSILEFDEAGANIKSHPILPPAVREGPYDAHINSFLVVEDSIYVMLHNGHRKLPSEIVELDRQFRERRRIVLPSVGCHDIVRLEDGSLLYCDSQSGSIARDDGFSLKIDELFTRGLAVGGDEIAVGSSFFGARIARTLLPGFVTFLDRGYNRIDRLYLAAAPTQIRRLDGADLSYRGRVLAEN